MEAYVFAKTVENNKIEESLELLLLKLGGLGKFVSNGNKVLIKPNMFLEASAESGLITHPKLIIALAKMCKELGANTLVGERNGNIHKNFEHYPEIYNYAKVVDFDNEEITLRGPCKDNRVIDFPLPLTKSVEEADVIINVPALRTHVLTKLSNSMKNLMGFLPKFTTKIIHLAGLDDAIVDLNKLINIDLTITDAIYSLSGYYPSDLGQAMYTNFLLASTDPVAIDAIAADIVGYIPDEIDTIRIGNLTGIGISDLKKIYFKGDFKKNTSQKYHHPKSGDDIYRYQDKLNIYCENACEKCRRSLANAIYCFYNENCNLDLDRIKKLNIITGSADLRNIKKGSNLIFGNCSKKYSELGLYIAGCPPLTGQAKNALKKLYMQTFED